MGQSNMAGTAPYSKETKPVDRCFLLDDQGQWVPATHPFNRFSTIRKKLGMQKMNPGQSFAQAILDQQENIRIGLVVNARGGTRIEQWDRETQFYQEAIQRTQLAMKSGTLKGILWHQGEGNSTMPAGYLEKLKTLINNLRIDLKSPQLPFVAGQIKVVTPPKKGTTINQLIEQLPDTVSQTGFASSKGLTTFDQWHFDASSMKQLGQRYAEQMLKLQATESQKPENPDAFSTRKKFQVAGQPAFVLIPKKSTKPSQGWVWYAPTLGNHLPGPAEQWMFDRFHQAGIAVAGIDVGESYGSPRGRALYQAFYEALVQQQGFSRKPVLLARSRGGLMLYNWAVEHPFSVGGIAGIYPVCNLASYPGIARAAGAYQMTSEELNNKLKEHNPIHRLKPLAKAGVPIFHLQGDNDKIVPLQANSAIVETQYRKFGGPVEIQIIQGQGHNLWNGWFTSKKLVEFVIKNASPK
ncbi:MAG: sialate O-acetylesterase [Planctomycetota bacterium]|nr:sialate O-acetylesterase [Planctomycetota bacterium]